MKQGASQPTSAPNNASFSFGMQDILKHNPSQQKQAANPQFPSFNPTQIAAANSKNRPLASPSFGTQEIATANNKPVSPSFGPDEINKFNPPSTTNPLQVLSEHEKKQK